MVISWFRSRLAPKARPGRSPQLRFRPAVQALEGRDCPSFGAPGFVPTPSIPPVTPAPPVHVINGVSTATTDDVIIIAPSGLGSIGIVQWHGQYHMEMGAPTHDAGTTPTFVRGYNVLLKPGLTVEVNAGDGDDIVINLTTVRCRVFGGAGNDQVFGGNGNDEIYGGVGNDIIAGLAGDDYLYGDYGARVTSLQSIYGNDILIGNDGSDHLFGEDGLDSMWGGNSPMDNNDGDVDYLDANSYFNGSMWTQGLDDESDLVYVELSRGRSSFIRVDVVLHGDSLRDSEQGTV
jgi:Ca2+-binding RTX toxin-like protein